MVMVPAEAGAAATAASPAIVESPSTVTAETVATTRFMSYLLVVMVAS
jgi:hypothetical protein